MNKDIIENITDFGFVSGDNYIYSWRGYNIDITNNILITHNEMLRFKNLMELWNHFIIIYD